MSLLSLIPTALWQAIGGVVLVLMGWVGVKAYGRAAERKGAAEARQQQESVNARATLDAVEAARRVGADPGLRDELRSRHTRP